MTRFHLSTMTCSGCLKAVSSAIRNLDPDARIEADLETREVSIHSSLEEAALRRAIVAAGFPAELVLETLG